MQGLRYPARLARAHARARAGPALCLLLASFGWLAGAGAPAEAAVNAATLVVGDATGPPIEGADGTGTARIELNSIRLALVNRAWLPDGTLLADGTPVTPGSEIYLVLTIDNVSDYRTDPFDLADTIDESQFEYVAGTLEYAVVPSASVSATVWGGPWQPLTDAIGAPDDEASMIDTGGPAEADRVSVSVSPGQLNRPVSIPAQTLWALRFRVRVK